MAIFVGRTEETAMIDEIFKRGSQRAVCVYGRRRMGVSAVARNFADGRNCLVVSIPDGTPRKAVEAIGASIGFFRKEAQDVDSVNTAFAALSGVCGRDIGIIFDGLESALADKEFYNAFLAFAKKHVDAGGFLMVAGTDALRDFCVCGPLGDVVTTAIMIGPLTRADTSKMHGKMSPVDRFRTYLTVGGVPLYNALMKQGDYESAVEKNFLKQYPKLVAEAEILERSAAVPYEMCTSILDDIAGFVCRPVDIARREGISRQLCDVYLSKMENEGFIRRMTPVEDAPKKPVYYISVDLLSFYHTVIRGNPDVIYREQPEYRDIRNRVDLFMDLKFRSVCLTWLENHFDCKTVGGWWIAGESTNAANVAAAVDLDGVETFVLADCKFRWGKIDSGVLEELKKRAERSSSTKKRLLMIFSVSGFDKKLLKDAEKSGVVLIGPEEFGLM